VTISSSSLTFDDVSDDFHQSGSDVTSSYYFEYISNTNSLIPSGQLLSTSLIYSSWCGALSPKPVASTISDQSYTIFSGTQYFTFDAFTTDLGCSDGTFSYSFTKDGSSTLSP